MWIFRQILRFAPPRLRWAPFSPSTLVPAQDLTPPPRPACATRSLNGGESRLRERDGASMTSPDCATSLIAEKAS
jgi:hypothetical protein